MVVLYIVVLVALAAVVGFWLGQRRARWFVMLATGAVLAILSAFVLQSMGLEAPVGIPVIVVCLALNQGAYVVGLLAGDGDGDGGRRNGTLSQQQAYKSPSDGRNDDVRHKREWQYEAPSHGG
jgi:hypothetical protein